MLLHLYDGPAVDMCSIRQYWDCDGGRLCPILLSAWDYHFEFWKLVPRYSRYVCSTLGRIKNVQSGKILMQESDYHNKRDMRKRIGLTDSNNDIKKLLIRKTNRMLTT